MGICIIIIVAILFFLIFREVYCWFFKTNQILNRLDSLEYKLLNKNMNIEISNEDGEIKQIEENKEENKEDNQNASSSHQQAYFEPDPFLPPSFTLGRFLAKKHDKSDENN